MLEPVEDGDYYFCLDVYEAIDYSLPITQTSKTRDKTNKSYNDFHLTHKKKKEEEMLSS